MAEKDTHDYDERDKPPLDYDPDYVHTEGYFKGYKNRDIPDQYDHFRKKYQKPTVDFSKTPYLNDRDRQVIDTKAFIVKDILNSGESQRLPIELLDEIRLRVTGENRITAYYRDFKIADYMPSHGFVEEEDETDAVDKFRKLAREVYNVKDIRIIEYERSQQQPMGDEEFNSLLSEINDLKVETEIRDAVKENAKSNLEAKTSLETTRLKIEEENARQYHAKIESLESQIESLKSSKDQRKIESLERQIEIITEDAKDEITRLEESLQLKTNQLLETQEQVDSVKKQMDHLKGEKESFRFLVESSEQENEDLSR